MARRKGRWVFVPEGCRAEIKPLSAWQTRPPEFYCLLRSQIACKLFLRDIRRDLYDYCIANAVLPPPIRAKWRLENWIEAHRTAAAAVMAWQGRGAKRSGNARRGVNRDQVPCAGASAAMRVRASTMY